MADIIMCRPTFFDVTRRSPTNRMMDPGNPPTKNLAMTQWENLYRNYRQHGIVVEIMESHPGLDDMTFIANAGLPMRRHFILSNFLEHERQGEKRFNRSYFEVVYGADKVLSLSDQAVFEGQGDALFINDQTLLLGHGIRTNDVAVGELISLIHRLDPGITVLPLQFNALDFYPSEENVFYHLDTCLLYIDRINTFLVNPRPFKSEALNKLRQFGEVICIGQRESESFVCNSVVAGNVVFTPQIGKCWARGHLQHNGYVVIEHDMSEFLKSGGAVKCLSLEMNG